MKNREFLEVMKEPILKNRGKFLALALILAGESALSLLLPQGSASILTALRMEKAPSPKSAVSLLPEGRKTAYFWHLPSVRLDIAPQCF